MAEEHRVGAHSEGVILEIGQDVGALVIYTTEALAGREIEVSLRSEQSSRVHTDVLERRVNGRPVFAAVFASLPAGTYTIWGYDPKPVDTVTIEGGAVTEVDWRS